MLNIHTILATVLCLQQYKILLARIANITVVTGAAVRYNSPDALLLSCNMPHMVMKDVYIMLVQLICCNTFQNVCFMKKKIFT